MDGRKRKAVGRFRRLRASTRILDSFLYAGWRHGAGRKLPRAISWIQLRQPRRRGATLARGCEGGRGLHRERSVRRAGADAEKVGAEDYGKWWAWEDSNLQPVDYEPNALTIELQARRAAPYDTATTETRQGPGEGEEVAHCTVSKLLKIERRLFTNNAPQYSRKSSDRRQAGVRRGVRWRLPFHSRGSRPPSCASRETPAQRGAFLCAPGPVAR